MSSTPPPSPTRSTASSRFAPYRHALNALAARTGTPLPSLILSFGVIHELTAVVPLAGFFFGARALGIGDRIVHAVTLPGSPIPDGWAKDLCRHWVGEGEKWAERVGRRYGVLGFEKRVGREEDSAALSSLREDDHEAPGNELSARFAGDAANAVVAYGLTKALLPVRIGASLYLSPAFSRHIVEPIRLSVVRLFRRKGP